MKKTTAKIREGLARLQEQLKQAETREAERIGRIALKAGLGEIEIEDGVLQAAFEEVAKRFPLDKPAGKGGSNGKDRGGAGASGQSETTPLTSGTPSGQGGEA